MSEIAELEEELDGELKKFEKKVGYVFILESWVVLCLDLLQMQVKLVA